MDLNYFPGCTLHGTAHDYDAAITAVFKSLGINLLEIDDWNCCGASSAHILNPEASIQLPARNLLIASDHDRPLLTPCAACFHRLKICQAHLREHPEDHPNSAAIAGVEVLHINDMLLKQEILGRIQGSIKERLVGLKAVTYYGCLTVRPPQAMNHPHPEDPREMDTILKIIGAEPVKWSYKTDCCGGNLAMTRPEVVRKLSGNLFEAAREAGGEIIVTDCPMCQANLDTREKEIESERNTSFQIPVVYITELLAVAMGIPETGSWWRKHLVDPAPLLRSKGLAA